MAKRSAPWPRASTGSDDLVPRGDLRAARQQIAFGQVQIGSAHATAPDPNTDLARGGVGQVPLDAAQGSVVDGPGRLDDPGRP